MPKKLTSPADILQVALKKEQNACRFYEKLAETTQVDYVRNLLEKLHGEEIKHVRMIEKKIADLNIGRTL